MTTIAVIDYGMGNLRSVTEACKHFAGHIIVGLDVIELAKRFEGDGVIAD